MNSERIDLDLEYLDDLDDLQLPNTNVFQQKNVQPSRKQVGRIFLQFFMRFLGSRIAGGLS